jgi:hypothetical protein
VCENDNKPSFSIIFLDWTRDHWLLKESAAWNYIITENVSFKRHILVGAKLADANQTYFER